jgi:hypothetical protein
MRPDTGWREDARAGEARTLMTKKAQQGKGHLRVRGNAAARGLTRGKKAKAHHEAGHAVIARMLGLGITRATLVASDSGQGSADAPNFC